MSRHRAAAVLLALLVGCSSTEEKPPEPTPPTTPPPAPKPVVFEKAVRSVELRNADPTAVAEALRAAYEGVDVAVDKNALLIRRGKSKAKLDELAEYAKSCDESAARVDARTLPLGLTTVREVVRVFATARGVRANFEEGVGAAKLDVVAFPAAATTEAAWATTRKLLELRGAHCAEAQRTITVSSVGLVDPDWAPAVAVLAPRNARAAAAFLEVDGEVLSKPDELPRAGTSLVATEPGRVLLLGERAAVARASETLSALDSLPWTKDAIFFTVAASSTKGKDPVAEILEERCEARVVRGSGRRLGVVVSREKERQARALADVTGEGPKKTAPKVADDPRKEIRKPEPKDDAGEE